LFVKILCQMITDLFSDFISRSLYGNQLTGKIPSSICNFVNLLTIMKPSSSCPAQLSIRYNLVVNVIYLRLTLLL
jgi:hypothetical protein